MGDPIDPRSDIYSLGVVLYEMATGQVPFEAETPMAVVVKHIRDPLPAPSRVNPDVPGSLQGLIFRAMHKERSQRFPTASAMVEAMSAMTVPPLKPADSAATVTIGGVPPNPARTMPHDDAAVGAAHSDPPTLATGQAPGLRRLMAIGAAALVVLTLLFVFMRWNSPETDLTRAPSDTTPHIIETTAPAGVRPPRSEGMGAEPANATTPASSTAPRQPNPDTGIRRAPATAVTGALLTSEDTPSSVTIARETALLSAVARAEEDRRRRDADASARDPFPDQGDGTFVDRQTGFLWTASSSPRQGNDGVLWTHANTYCVGLTLGGRSNWQLPSREELDPVLQRLDPARYPWGLSLWSTSRPFGESNRLWVTNSPLYAPEWSSAVRDASARRLTHRAVCVARPEAD